MDELPTPLHCHDDAEASIPSPIGGTSFDVALITKGELIIKNDPDMARLVLSLPLVAMDSVGAGSFIRLDPYTKAIKLGPDSAGYPAAPALRGAVRIGRASAEGALARCSPAGSRTGTSSRSYRGSDQRPAPLSAGSSSG